MTRSRSLCLRTTSTTVDVAERDPSQRRRGVASEGLVDLRETLADDSDGRIREIRRRVSLERLPRRDPDAARGEQRVRLREQLRSGLQQEHEDVGVQRGAEAGQRGGEERVQEGEDQDLEDLWELPDVEEPGGQREGQGAGVVEQSGDAGAPETGVAYNPAEERGSVDGERGRDPGEEPETVLRVRGERKPARFREAGLSDHPEQLDPREHPPTQQHG